MEGDAGRFGGIQQQHVQCAAGNRPDHFAIIDPVTLQAGVAIAVVHHASAHHYRALQHVVGQSGAAQCLQPAFGQGEVDRAATDVQGWTSAAGAGRAGAAEKAGTPRIGPFLEHLDRKATLRQLLRQQRADQSAADEGDGLLRHAAIRGGSPSTVPQARSDCNAGGGSRDKEA
jgi:hypothetical protein